MKRPLVIIWLTIFVNLVGFGIIIPLLPFYADRFQASPFVVGALFAIFSLCQLVASPILGDWSDRFGRRPVLVFSLAGTVLSFVMLALANSIWMLFLARIVDGLSGGNISTARAYVADITEPKDRAHAYGLIGMAFGLGFIIGPALSGVLAGYSITAPIWAAAAITLVAALMALFWLPETVHKAQAGTGAPFGNLSKMMQRAGLRRVLVMDFFYWFSFSIFQTMFALFASARFNFDAVRTGYVFAGFGVLGAIIQGGFIRPLAKRLGDKPLFITGLVFGTAGMVATALSFSIPLFYLSLVPLAFGIGFGHPTISALVSRAGSGEEQGRVQGAASAMESLGRTLGPLLGSASMQQFNEGAPFYTAAAFLVVTLLMTAGYQVIDAGTTAPNLRI